MCKYCKEFKIGQKCLFCNDTVDTPENMKKNLDKLLKDYKDKSNKKIGRIDN
jgi:hypothetical protein